MESSDKAGPPTHSETVGRPSKTCAAPASRTVSADECAAHLELLELFADLRDGVAHHDGLFGLWNVTASSRGTQNRDLGELREKRWAVYVARAVDRFEAWYSACVRKEEINSKIAAITVHAVNRQNLHFARDRAVAEWAPERLPPLDVLMVWHAYMLNPRDFLEDCLRHQRLGLWHAGFPLTAFRKCVVDNQFEPPAAAREYFAKRTGREWENERDKNKEIKCPACAAAVRVPWTTTKGPGNLCRDGAGFTDPNFAQPCPQCTFAITHAALRVARFHEDAVALFKADVPLPGTLVPPRGVIELTTTPLQTYVDVLLQQGTNLDAVLQTQAVEDVRSLLENLLNNKQLVDEIRGSAQTTKAEAVVQRASLRRMLACYWENSSPFMLDLVGAVLRQGTFIAKMDEIDWLHSPALPDTLSHAVAKYEVFMQIIFQSFEMAVPTLDVDLAWHTHQLAPRRYYAYCVRKAGILVNHDDKVEEGKLSDGFERTSRLYTKLTRGELYTNCTCWYCEATRCDSSKKPLGKSPHLVNAVKLYKKNTGKPVHISAHNAIKPIGAVDEGMAEEVRRSKLEAKFEKTARRLRKRGISVLPPTHHNAPYAADKGISRGMYPSNPACATFLPNARGNCVSGTCTARASAGACTNGMCGGGRAGGPMGGCGALTVQHVPIGQYAGGPVCNASRCIGM